MRLFIEVLLVVLGLAVVDFTILPLGKVVTSRSYGGTAMKYEKQSRTQPPVITVVVLLIAFASWAVAAQVYAFTELGYQPEAPTDEKSLAISTLLFGVETFFYVTFSQLENFGAVIAFIFDNHAWFPATVVLVCSLVIAGAVGLRSLEQEINGSPKHRRPQY